MDPFFIVETFLDFGQASSSLEAAVTSHGFGVLGIHDLGQTLRSKGIAFKEQCRIFEVCNPKQANQVLNVQMKLNMALPCRISVYTDDNHTHIGMVRPEGMLLALSDDIELQSIATEVECTMIEIIQTASKAGRPC
jgi:uncharacterized protein (DUF302 family)